MKTACLATLVLALAACTEPVASTSPESTPSASAAGPATHDGPLAAPETVLMAVLFSPDGSMHIDSIQRRPIPFRGQHLVPYQASRHEPAATQPAVPQGANEPREMGPPAVDGSVNPGLSPPLQPPNIGARPLSAAGAILVRDPARPMPLVVPLDLGFPGEGGGDVADRWQHGGAIWRAPCFGAETEYTVLRLQAGGALVLAEGRATP